MVWQGLSGPATSDALTVLLTDGTETTFLQPLQARLLHSVATMQKDVHKPTTRAQWGYRGDHNKKVGNGTQTFYTRHNVYIDRPPMTNFFIRENGDWFVQQSNVPRIGPFRIVETSPNRVSFDEDGIWNTVSTDLETVAPAPRTIQNKMDDAKCGNKEGLPTNAMWKEFIRHIHIEWTY